MVEALQDGMSQVQVAMKSLNFLIYLILPAAPLAQGFSHPLTEMSTRRYSLLRVQHGRRVRPSVRRLSRQCGILSISQPHRPPRPGTGITLLVLIQFQFVVHSRKGAGHISKERLT
jgi:hypothetical protein